MIVSVVEKLNAMVECETEEQIPSLVIPHKTITVVRFHCPNCDNEIERPEHGEQCQCRHCDLYMLIYGNCLNISWSKIPSGMKG